MTRRGHWRASPRAFPERTVWPAGACALGLILTLTLAIASCGGTPIEGSGSGAATESSTGEDGTGSEASSTTTSSSGSASTGAPTISGTGSASEGTGAGPTTDPSGAGGGCDGIVTIELDVFDAELSGEWEVFLSGSLDRDVARFNGDPGDGGFSDAIVFTPEIPCDDDWYVWTQLRDEREADSFFMQIDGQPGDPVIFDGDCEDNEQTVWRWTLLRYRDPDAGLCDFSENPWVQSWDAGGHELRYMFRESIALADVVITNDPGYQP